MSERERECVRERERESVCYVRESESDGGELESLETHQL